MGNAKQNDVKSKKFFIVGIFLSLICASFFSTTTNAKGEQYTWENSTTITATGGNYAKPVTFQAASPYKPGTDNIPLFNFAKTSPREDRTGCLLNFSLKFNGKDNRSAQLIDTGLPNPLSDCIPSISDTYDRSINLQNAESAGAEAETFGLVVESVVLGGTFNGESDKITLKDANTGKVIATKEAKTKIDSESRSGFKVTFANSKPNITYEACSETLDLCAEKRIEASGGVFLTDLIDRTIQIQKEPENKSTCAINGIGWMVCPVMVFIGEMNDLAFSYLESLLQIRPALVTSPSTQAAWAAVRDIANVAFVIAFMVIVYSQLTGAGISNYGVKKMLPRIMIAAILVNVSYIITAIAVDLSNIAGSGIYSLLQESIAPNLSQSSLDGGWEKMIVGVLAGTTAVVVGILLAITIGPMALLALLLVILILVARQALVLMLVIIAPLAFVAYLLPNTEDLFKKWYKAFVAVLMVYPIVGLVFGGSTLAATILSSIAASTEDSSGLQFVALGVLAIPLFAVPAILKGSLAAAGSVGAKIQGLADRTQKGAFKDGSDRLGRRAAVLEGKMAKRGGLIGSVGNYRSRKNFRRTSAETLAKQEQESALTDHILDNPLRYSPAQTARAVASKQKMTQDEINNSMALLQNDDAATLIPRAVAQLERANKSGDVVAARAATQILSKQTGSKGVSALHTSITNMESAAGGLNEEVSANIRADISSAGLKGKDRALDTWSRFERSTDANGKPVLGADGKQIMKTLKEHDNHESTARGLNEVELAGQSVDQLKKFVDSKSMTHEQAQRVIEANKQGAIALDPAKLDIFQRRVAAATANSEGTPTSGS